MILWMFLQSILHRKSIPSVTTFMKPKLKIC